MFIYDDKTKTNIRTIDGVVFSCDEYNSKYDIEAERLAKLYDEKIDDIISFMLPSIQSFYTNMITAEVLKESLGMPLVDLTTKTISYCNHSLDNEHIFVFEYIDEFENLINLCIDG